MLNNKLIILGCGSSAGVPTAYHDWGQCDPSESRNLRTRCSAYVEIDTMKILLDTAPDLRFQMLKNHIEGVDAVFYTHAHADHTHGIDELRSLFFQRGKKRIPVYGAKETIQTLKKNFSYLFQPGKLGIYPQILEPHVIDGPFNIGKTDFLSFQQKHGEEGYSTGFRIGNIAYSTDFSYLDDNALRCLENLDLWVVDCASRDARPTHLSLQETLAWIRKVRPRKAILTHMNTTLDYRKTLESLPDSIEPAYDGLTLCF